MATYMTTPDDRHGALPLIGATAFTLLLLGGATLWLLRPLEETPIPTPAATTHSANEPARPIPGPAERLHDGQSAAVWSGAGAVERGGLAELHAEQATTRPAAPLVYLVVSPLHARTVRDDINTVGHALGGPALDAQVIVIDSVEADARFWSDLETENRLKEDLGLPPISVIDLRNRSPTSALSDGACVLTLRQTTCPPTASPSRDP